MTWTTIAIVWIVSGIVSAAWHIINEWWQHDVFENSKSQIVFETVIMILICFITGPVGLVIKIWETWFDPSNI